MLTNASTGADGEASAEVASGGRVGESASVQGVEEGLVIAAKFDVLEAGAVAQGVVGDVENVIGLVIRQVDFEEMQPFIDGLGEADLMNKVVNEPDAALDDGPITVREVIVDGAVGENGPVRGGITCRVESALDSGLASAEPVSEDRVHLKSFVGSGRLGSGYFHDPRKLRRISSI